MGSRGLAVVTRKDCSSIMALNSSQSESSERKIWMRYFGVCLSPGGKHILHCRWSEGISVRVFSKLVTDLGGPSHCGGGVTPGLVVLVSTTKEAEQVVGSKAVKWHSSMTLCQLLHSGFYPFFFQGWTVTWKCKTT